MNLPELQRILARLVTSPDLRERFLRDPEGVGDSLGWDIGLTRNLATIPAHRLRHYGESLINKRCREASRWLPPRDGLAAPREPAPALVVSGLGACP